VPQTAGKHIVMIIWSFYLIELRILLLMSAKELEAKGEVYRK